MVGPLIAPYGLGAVERVDVGKMRRVVEYLVLKLLAEPLVAG